MKFAIEIQDMTQAELAAVTAFLTSMGAQPTSKTSKTVAELAALTGVAPSAPMTDTPAPPSLPAHMTPPAAAPAPQVVTDPFSAPPPAHAANGEIDVRGVPHNPTFHAESKRKTNDGSWAKRKGVDKDACAAYEAPFLTGTPATAPTTQPTAAELNQQFAPHLVTPPAAAPVSDPFATPVPPISAPAVAAPTAPPAPTPAVAAPPPVTYNQWFDLYNNLMIAGKITPEQYSTIAERYGAIENPMKFMDDENARAASYVELMVYAK